MTTTSASPVTLDEQLANDIALLRVEAAQYPHDDYRRAQLNGIADRLKRIREAGDVEPVAWYEPITKSVMRADDFAKNDFASPADWKPLSAAEVLDLLAAERERHGQALKAANVLGQIARDEAELAESRLAKVMEALREPSEEMINALAYALTGDDEGPLTSQHKYYADSIKAMSSVLLSEVKGTGH